MNTHTNCPGHEYVTAYTFEDCFGHEWEHLACIYCTAGYDSKEGSWQR